MSGSNEKVGNFTQNQSYTKTINMKFIFFIVL